MISYKDIKEAQDTLIKYWGNDGEKVIEECARINPFNESMEVFMEYCVCCGGNWNGMFLSGIKTLFPSVYNIIPNNMGKNAFYCICAVMLLCGVDYKED